MRKTTSSHVETPGERSVRPRVLFLAHRIPYPPDKGDKIRTCNQVRALGEKADLTIACFLDDPADEAAVPPLRELCSELIVVRLDRRMSRLRSLLALPGRRSLSLAYYRSAAMRRALQSLLERTSFDALFVFSSTMAPYGELFDRVPRRVLDLCDLDSAKWSLFARSSPIPLSWIYATEGRRLARYEREAARAYGTTLLVSRAERDELSCHCPGADLRVLPNGVDLDYYDPTTIGARPDPNAMVFCGAMGYRPNVDAVCRFHDEILPRVRTEIPEARFRIVGSNPAPAVQALARTPGVVVTGRVPDVRPEILGAAVSVAPLRLGRGVPNKVLEALALTLPVVTTSNGAAGLDLADFEGVDVADTSDAFAAAVVRRLRLAASGHCRHPEHRRLLAERYSWERQGAKLREIVLGES